VLFAHGWISSRRMWYDVAEMLDGARYSLHLLDFRGCGRSDRPADHRFEAYASDLRAALATLEPGAVLVGHSMGGRLAQFVAAERPAALAKVVLVAPGALRALRPNPGRRKLAEAAYGSREGVERFIRSSMRREIAPEAMRRIVDDALECQREHWFGVFDSVRADYSERLSGIAVPVLAVAGDGDPLAPPRVVKRDVAAPIGGSIFVTLKGCGHNPPVEAPREIAQAVERW
jgi:pimeloyl-ACP methyl ester carboxylesterase